MRIRIVCIGKLKERYWSEAVEEYSKRLSRYCELEIVQLKEARLPDRASLADEQNVIFEEGQSILKNLKEGSHVITLEIKGKELSSESLAAYMGELQLEGKSDITFVIGGSLGLSEQVSARADFRLSFSRMTFPHQMMRVLLLEQIYRAFKILRNETYHK